jgi:FAD-dependent urate hydroxylase
MTVDVIKVAIVGAGPYGLSLATHLRDSGIGFRIFGKPMQTWRDMPRGMFLKSFCFATNVYTPDAHDDFVSYSRERGLESFEPCSIADFARYGVWVQQRRVPELEETNVTSISRKGAIFEVTLADGKTCWAECVVVAAGVVHFASMPVELARLPRDMASHTSEHSEYDSLAGKDVCIVGGGQSAFEAARLLGEAGARPQLLVRAPEVSFSSKMPPHRNLWERVRRPQSALGPGLKNWVLEKFPLFMHYVPDRWRVPFVNSHLGPQGAWWLRHQIEGKVPIFKSCTIVNAAPAGGRLALRVRIDGGSEQQIVCDHAIAATGYVVDIDRLDFIDADLRRSIHRIERGPALNARFESSVPGLYFVGLASSLSFGPLFRFVAGASPTSKILVHEFARRRASRGAQQTSQDHAATVPVRGWRRIGAG